MFTFIHMHNYNYNALIEIDNKQYTVQPPFKKKKVASIEADKEGFRRSFATANGLRDYLLLQYYFLALDGFYDLIKKVNEGSLDIKTTEQLERKVITKLENQKFLLHENPLVLRNYMHTYLMFFPANEVQEFCEDYFHGSKIHNLINHDLKLLGVWNKDKKAFVELLHLTYLPRMKKFKKWQSYMKATFSLWLISVLHGYKDSDALRIEYSDACKEYERNTGLDPNYSRFQKYTDRRSRTNYYNEHRSKQK
ncbi:hypothetical protein L1267_11015 [Pseudoalteromonas sp. OFAV1]|uniref:hypothetical protein n=1 Tax=Pseudoalteromonas sp. OFAV1 TaxID=2908892 RepID=UPI001F1F0F9D|nr:hypothetical protein [Pseudoalteromonas sp. OFAV1]MCF2900934.1 hypothetical protein [Pseudoalteromonas sp. OFAV1]